MVGARLTLRLYRVMGEGGGAVGRPRTIEGSIGQHRAMGRAIGHLTTIEGSMGQRRAMGRAIGHPTTIEGSIGQPRALWGSYGVEYGAL